MASLSMLLLISFSLTVIASPKYPKNGGSTVWTGWGGSVSNRRWVQQSAFNSANVNSTVPHCQLQYPKGESAPPTLHGDIAYYPTWNGSLVAMNYKTCETLWQTNITQVIFDFKPISTIQALVGQAVARTSPQLDCGILYLGTQIHALLLAVDAEHGTVLGIKQVSSEETMF
jgi:outer membrane protein assembly factor BamB